MLFGDGKKSTPRWKPLHCHIIRLYWLGFEPDDIAGRFGIPLSTVQSVIRSDQAKVILRELESKAYDSALDVITAAQAAAPEMLQEKITLALSSPDERVRSRNATDVLAIAGHTPVHRVSIERPDPISEAYKDKTPDQLRKELMDLKLLSPTDRRGPDGNLVN